MRDHIGRISKVGVIVSPSCPCRDGRLPEAPLRSDFKSHPPNTSHAAQEHPGGKVVPPSRNQNTRRP